MGGDFDSGETDLDSGVDTSTDMDADLNSDLGEDLNGDDGENIDDGIDAEADTNLDDEIGEDLNGDGDIADEPIDEIAEEPTDGTGEEFTDDLNADENMGAETSEEAIDAVGGEVTDEPTSDSGEEITDEPTGSTIDDNSSHIEQEGLDNLGEENDNNDVAENNDSSENRYPDGEDDPSYDGNIANEVWADYVDSTDDDDNIEPVAESGDTKKPYSDSRPSYGENQVDDVWNAHVDPKTGTVRDPSGAEITWDRDKLRAGQWDMGHIPGEQYRDVHERYMNGEIDKDEFLEWYRNPDNYRPELPSTNRGRQYES